MAQQTDHIGDTNKMVTMKLFSEEQVKEMINDVGGGFVWYYDIIKKHTPIELPSDEEIIKNAPVTSKDADDYLISNKIGFVHGAKWMRDKILNPNK